MSMYLPIGNFQFTTSRGGRRFLFFLNGQCLFPFNSRPHEEVDMSTNARFKVIRTFNSRPHDEVDIKNGGNLSDAARLSIHDLTRRSTWFIKRFREIEDLSIHDLTRRSTASAAQTTANNNLSIHDLTRRSTLAGKILSGGNFFQFTTSRGGRRRSLISLLQFLSFNSRPHEEVDLYLVFLQSRPRSFNSRPHEEVDQMILKQS